MKKECNISPFMDGKINQMSNIECALMFADEYVMRSIVSGIYKVVLFLNEKHEQRLDKAHYNPSYYHKRLFELKDKISSARDACSQRNWQIWWNCLEKYKG